jgi:O-antigen/teichoic acid export membrane protein
MSSDPGIADRAPNGSAGAGSGDVVMRIVRNTSVLAITNLVVRGLGMVLMVLLARYLGAQGYGTYQRAEAFVLLFSMLANLGLDVILTREVARGDRRVPEHLAGVVVLKLVLGLVTCGLVLGIAYARGYEGDFLYSIWMYAIVLFLGGIAQAEEAVFQGREKMGRVAVASLANQCTVLVLGLAGIAMHKDLRWFLTNLAVATAVRLAVSTALLVRSGVDWQRPKLATLRYLLTESLPIAFAASFVIVYQQVDAVMLGEMKGNTEVGWYKASAKFLLFFIVLRESFLQAVFPVFSSIASLTRERLGHLVTRVVRYQVVIALYFVLCFVFLARLAPRLLGPEFENSAHVLPVMAWILVPQIISITTGRALIASGDQARIMVGTGLSLIVNVGLNLLLIPRFSYLGAAVSGVTSEVVVAAVNLYFFNRLVAPTALTRALAKPVLAAALAGVGLYAARALPLYVAFPLAAVLYGGALLALRAFSAEEWRQVRSVATRAKSRLINGHTAG